jgi:hypothetical protein
VHPARRPCACSGQAITANSARFSRVQCFGSLGPRLGPDIAQFIYSNRSQISPSASTLNVFLHSMSPPVHLLQCVPIPISTGASTSNVFSDITQYPRIVFYSHSLCRQAQPQKWWARIINTWSDIHFRHPLNRLYHRVFGFVAQPR